MTSFSQLTCREYLRTANCYPNKAGKQLKSINGGNQTVRTTVFKFFAKKQCFININLINGLLRVHMFAWDMKKNSAKALLSVGAPGSIRTEYNLQICFPHLIHTDEQTYVSVSKCCEILLILFCYYIKVRFSVKSVVK